MTLYFHAGQRLLLEMYILPLWLLDLTLGLSLTLPQSFADGSIMAHSDGVMDTLMRLGFRP